MKRRLSITLLILAALTASTSAMAQTISEAVARQMAQAVFAGRLSSQKEAETAGRKQIMPAVAAPVLSYTSQSDDEVYYYAYNNPSGGFVIIGGDEQARDILGYGATGTFCYDSIPENMRWWLRQYEKQIHAAKKMRAGNRQASNGDEVLAISSRSDIEPLVKTKWGQNAPYSYSLTGFDAKNTLLVTGCWNTATAQVLKTLHDAGWDIQGRDSLFADSTVTCTADATTGEMREFTLPAVNTLYDYDWNNMLYTYNTSSAEDMQDVHTKAVAELMARLCRATNTMYEGVYGSGNYSFNVSIGLAQCFNFDKSLQLCIRYEYTDSEWEQMVYDELARGVPVLYSGGNADGGHAFVVDGYTESETPYSASQPGFHINWGWNGGIDGYFPLTGTVNVDGYTVDGLNPWWRDGNGNPQSLYTFNIEQGIICGLKIDEGGKAEMLACSDVTFDDEYQVYSATAAPESDVTLYYEAMNVTHVDFAYDCALRMTDLQTQKVTITELGSTGTLRPRGLFQKAMELKAPKEEGTYALELVWKDGQSRWRNTWNYIATLSVDASMDGISDITEEQTRASVASHVVKTASNGQISIVVPTGSPSQGKRYTITGQRLR